MRIATRFTVALAGAFFIFDATVLTAQERPDFSGHWETPEREQVIRPDDNPDYTEEALRRNRLYDRYFDESTESPAMKCATIGVPWMMLGRARDYITEIHQTPTRIVATMEYMDQFRIIRLDETEFPPNIPASIHGYSIGHWEDDELVVKTKGFISTSEATREHRSDEAVVTERWKLIQHEEYGEVLVIDITMDDPVFYKTPAVGRGFLSRAPEGTVAGGYNCPYTLWENYIYDKLDRLDYQD